MSSSNSSTGAPCLVKNLVGEIIKDQPDEICEKTFTKICKTPVADNGESNVTENTEGCRCLTEFKYKAESFNEDQGECDQELLGNNILHLAISFNKKKTACAIMKAFPELMFGKIKTTKIDSHITPFHIAIATCPKIVPDMIKKAEDSDKLKPMLREVMKPNTQGITDSTTKGTVLMGQLPFHVAVLGLIISGSRKADIKRQEEKDDAGEIPNGVEILNTLKNAGADKADIKRQEEKDDAGEIPNGVEILNTLKNAGADKAGIERQDEEKDDAGEIPNAVEMLDILENAGANITKTNYLGDTFLHSIMRFVHCFPLEEKNAIEVMEYLIRRKRPRKQDDDGYKSTLRKILFQQNKEHATALQLAVKFGHVEIFQYLIKEEGLYNRKVELHDDVYQIQRMDITEFDKVTLVSQPSAHNAQQSVIELLCCLSLGKAIDMVKSDVFEKIIERKWRHYQIYFYLAFLFHIFFLVWLSFYAVAKAYATQGKPILPELFLLVTQICSVIISLVYLCQEVIFRIICARQPFACKAVHHNVVYRVCTILFSTLLILDVIVGVSFPYNNHSLIVALIIGTWNILFFLRINPVFGIYIVLINEALIKIAVPFLLLVFMQVSIFTVGMHATFLLPKDLNGTIDDFETYGKSLLYMGRLMVGLYDFEDILKSRHIEVVMLLYGVYILITFILLINALVAIMTNRFTEPQEEKIYVGYVQKLSIIVFMEAFPFLPVAAVKKDEMAVRFKDGNRRYIMSYRTIHYKDADNPSSMIHKQLEDFSMIHKRLEDFSMIHKGLEDLSMIHKGLEDLSMIHKRLEDFSMIHKGLEDFSMIHKGLEDFSMIHKRLEDFSRLQDIVKDMKLMTEKMHTMSKNFAEDQKTRHDPPREPPSNRDGFPPGASPSSPDGLRSLHVYHYKT